MQNRILLCSLVAVGSLACRPDLGDPDYPEITPYVDTDGGGGLAGEKPFDPATPRLSFGQFYEGGSTDELPVDDENVFYFIYQGYSQSPSTNRVEGFQSDELTLTGGSWWGGGIQFPDGVTRDLSQWDSMHIALLSEDEGMSSFRFGVAGEGGEVRVNPADHGFVPDGEWHNITLPMSTFAGADLTRVRVALLLISESGSAGDSILIDDFYLEGE